ncbi:hypothetical protein M673_24075 (plasmid) [Aureimonas sp. AU20]|nr:hypothetical protein M673_24075 [Aureimonas sp. AU20]
MRQSALLGTRMSSIRDCAWFLEQDEDGALFVSYENDDDPSDNWRKPLAEVLADQKSSTAKMVQERVNRMFERRKV